jgi:hypothetical protein
MLYVKIAGKLYPAIIVGKTADHEWDNRPTKSITIEMDVVRAKETFVDGLTWSIVRQDRVPVYETENGEVVLDDEGNPVILGTELKDTEFDNSEYDMAGPITDHRDGKVTVKMGKITDAEALAELMEVLA